MSEEPVFDPMVREDLFEVGPLHQEPKPEQARAPFDPVTFGEFPDEADPNNLRGAINRAGASEPDPRSSDGPNTDGGNGPPYISREEIDRILGRDDQDRRGMAVAERLLRMGEAERREVLQRLRRAAPRGYERTMRALEVLRAQAEGAPVGRAAPEAGRVPFPNDVIIEVPWTFAANSPIPQNESPVYSGEAEVGWVRGVVIGHPIGGVDAIRRGSLQIMVTNGEAIRRDSEGNPDLSLMRTGATIANPDAQVRVHVDREQPEIRARDQHGTVRSFQGVARNTITFEINGRTPLVLGRDGFVYNGERIEDGGQAYERFMEFLRQTQERAMPPHTIDGSSQRRVDGQ
jgi:hypothetical protein